MKDALEISRKYRNIRDKAMTIPVWKSHKTHVVGGRECYDIAMIGRNVYSDDTKINEVAACVGLNDVLRGVEPGERTFLILQDLQNIANKKDTMRLY